MNFAELSNEELVEMSMIGLRRNVFVEELATRFRGMEILLVEALARQVNHSNLPDGVEYRGPQNVGLSTVMVFHDTSEHGQTISLAPNVATPERIADEFTQARRCYSDGGRIRSNRS